MTQYQMKLTGVPDGTLCLGGTIKLSECAIEFCVPLNLSDESFYILSRCFAAHLMHADKQRKIHYPTAGQSEIYELKIAELFPDQQLQGYPADQVFTTESDKPAGAEDPVVRSVIEQLDKDVVSTGDRGRLRDAVTQADTRANKHDPWKQIIR